MPLSDDWSFQTQTCPVCQDYVYLIFRPEELISFDHDRFNDDSLVLEYTQKDFSSSFDVATDDEIEVIDFSRKADPYFDVTQGEDYDEFDNFMLCCNAHSINCHCDKSYSFSAVFDNVFYLVTTPDPPEEIAYQYNIQEMSPPCEGCSYFATPQCAPFVSWLKKAEAIGYDGDYRQWLTDNSYKISPCENYTPVHQHS